MEVETCILCGDYCVEGLAVRRRVICKQCEQKIVLADVSNAEYEQLKCNLRKLWAGVPLREV